MKDRARVLGQGGTSVVALRLFEVSASGPSWRARAESTHTLFTLRSAGPSQQKRTTYV